MDTLFKDMAEVKAFVTVDISANIKTIAPYLVESHRFLLRGIDNSTFSGLLDYYKEHTSTDEAYEAILPYCQRVLANFAYAISTDRLGIFVGENGMMEYGNNTLKAIEPAKQDRYKSEFFLSGYNALEDLILFVQDNKDSYSEAYSFLFDKTFFVNTARELNNIIKTDIRNRDFFDMMPNLFLIEQEIEGIIGADIAGALKSIAGIEDATDNQKAMLDIIKPAEALLAYADKFKSEKHMAMGVSLMEKLRQLVATINGSVSEKWDNTNKKLYVFR
jgi:hypothetical protein